MRWRRLWSSMIAAQTHLHHSQASSNCTIVPFRCTVVHFRCTMPSLAAPCFLAHSHCTMRLLYICWLLAGCCQHTTVVLTCFGRPDAPMMSLTALSPSSEHIPAINKCFSQDSVPAIIAALEAEGTEWATKQVSTLARMSPTSMAITHKQLTLGAWMEWHCARVCARVRAVEGARVMPWLFVKSHMRIVY